MGKRVTSSGFGMMKFVVKNSRLKPKMYREGSGYNLKKAFGSTVELKNYRILILLELTFLINIIGY